jgi:hypothetical protein
MPDGSKPVNVNDPTNSTSGTPYCMRIEIAIAKLCINERKAEPSLYIDKDLSEPAFLVLAGRQIDLVPTEDRLLRIALAAEHTAVVPPSLTCVGVKCANRRFRDC